MSACPSVHITSGLPVVGVESARLHFDGCNGKERNGKGIGIRRGRFVPVAHTGLISVVMYVYRTTDAVGLWNCASLYSE